MRAKSPISAAAIERIMHAGVPLTAEWGVEVVAAAEGVALLRLPPAPRLLRPGGVISGPALMGLADAAFWCALLSLTEGRDESLTSSLSITFLRRVPPRAVMAEAQVLKRGRILAYGEVTLREEGSDTTLAHITSTWAVSPANS